MNATIDITVGDNGLVIAGTAKFNGFKGVASLVGYSVTFSLIREPFGPSIVDRAMATIDSFDGTKGTMHFRYHLQSADVAEPAIGRVRWTLTTPNGIVHFPGPLAKQTIVRINS